MTAHHFVYVLGKLELSGVEPLPEEIIARPACNGYDMRLNPDKREIRH